MVKRFASVAQLVEQLTLNQWVPGSSPGGCTSIKAYRFRSVSLFSLSFLPVFREVFFPVCGRDNKNIWRIIFEKRKAIANIYTYELIRVRRNDVVLSGCRVFGGLG